MQGYVICTAEAIGMSDKESLFRHHMDDMAANAQVLPANRPATKWHQHVVRTAEATGLSGKEGLFQLAASTYRPRRARGSSSAGEEASEEEVTHAKHAEGNTCTGLQFVQCICVNRDMSTCVKLYVGRAAALIKLLCKRCMLWQLCAMHRLYNAPFCVVWLSAPFNKSMYCT